MNRNRIIIILLSIVAVVLMADAVFAQDVAAATAPQSSWAEELYNWFKEHMNYTTIIVLMAIESSVVPLPSEVVVPPAAYFSLQANSSLDFWVVILSATLGAYLGSAINYGLSMIIGRPIIYSFADSKVGHFLRLSKEKMERAEQYFQKKGSISIFFGRLLPAVRHLISIPAGLSRMNFGTFSFFTIIGAGIWNVVLAGLGYLLYRIVPDDSQFFAQLEHYNHYLKIAGFALLGAVVLYICYKVYKNKKKTTEHNDEKTN
ncbi:MAG: DedA family protein [Muribaculaceae bacterium]|nr:DedA family protein [Muribaculaceae bacterium]